MRAIMVQNYAHPKNGCLNIGERISTEGEAGSRAIDSGLLKSLIESDAAVALDHEGNPTRPKRERATKGKSGETATKGE